MVRDSKGRMKTKYILGMGDNPCQDIEMGEKGSCVRTVRKSLMLDHSLYER